LICSKTQGYLKHAISTKITLHFAHKTNDKKISPKLCQWQSKGANAQGNERHDVNFGFFLQVGCDAKLRMEVMGLFCHKKEKRRKIQELVGVLKQVERKL